MLGQNKKRDVEKKQRESLGTPWFLDKSRALPDRSPPCNLRFLDKWSFGQVDYEQEVTLTDVWTGERRHQVLARMHATACIAHCTHPMSRYNEIIAVLRDTEKPHSAFV